MKHAQPKAIVAALICSSFACNAARAQFSGGTTAVASLPITSELKGQVEIKARMRYGAASINYAPFFNGGRFPGPQVSLPGSSQTIGPGGTQVNAGPLVTGDAGWRTKAGRKVETGGWYWTRGHHDLYELHGRLFLSENLGVQVGYLASTTDSGSAMDGFVFYDITSASVNPKATRKWAIEVGAGPFIDFTKGKTTNSITFFIQGSYALTRRVSVNLSQWFVRDRSVDNNRIALGVGYTF